MVIYQLDYVVEEVLQNQPSFEQKTLKDYTGANFTKEEAKYVWKRVIDHKWYVGERLRRDIGLRVAAVDFVENFYNASMFRVNDGGMGLFNRISHLMRGYFAPKNKTLSSL